MNRTAELLTSVEELSHRLSLYIQAQRSAWIDDSVVAKSLRQFEIVLREVNSTLVAVRRAGAVLQNANGGEPGSVRVLRVSPTASGDVKSTLSTSPDLLSLASNLANAHRGGLVRVPAWALDRNYVQMLNAKRRPSASPSSAPLGVPYSGQWGEDEYAWNEFFSGFRGGTFIEMGAIDGVTFSNTLAFERGAEWKGILIEGSPESFEKLVANRPNQVLVNAPVCEEWRSVDYVVSGGGPVRGVGDEWKDEKAFIQQFHANGMQVEKLVCVPLQAILDSVGLTHVNFFSLDVEGSEAAVLKSLDWARVSFDVIVIETDKLRGFDVDTFMRERGYGLYHTEALNSWYLPVA